MKLQYIQSLGNDQYANPEEIGVEEAILRMLDCEEMDSGRDDGKQEFTLWGYPRHGDKVRVVPDEV